MAASAAGSLANLLGRGDRVWIYDLKEDPKRLRLIIPEADVRRIRFLQGDVTDLPRLREALTSERHHAHRPPCRLAGAGLPGRSDPRRQGQRHRHARRLRGGPANGAARCSGSSTPAPPPCSARPSAYGPGPLADDVPLVPSTHYGVFKCCNEGNARIYFQDFGISSIGLRPWTVYGVGRDFGMTSEPTKAIKSLALGRPYHISYGGVQDLQYVDDVAGCIVRCLERRTRERSRTTSAATWSICRRSTAPCAPSSPPPNAHHVRRAANRDRVRSGRRGARSATWGRCRGRRSWRGYAGRWGYFASCKQRGGWIRRIWSETARRSS